MIILDLKFYIFIKAVVKKYRPDFLIRLKSGNYLVLETKGKDSGSGQNKTRISWRVDKCCECSRRIWLLVVGCIEKSGGR